jgi:hypothetical protein
MRQAAHCILCVLEVPVSGLFSEINLNSEKLGKDYTARNATLCTVIKAIAEGLEKFSTDKDTLGDAYEYLIGQFAAGSGKKAGEFYTPQQISSILSGIVTLDSQEPAAARAGRGSSSRRAGVESPKAPHPRRTTERLRLVLCLSIARRLTSSN